MQYGPVHYNGDGFQKVELPGGRTLSDSDRIAEAIGEIKAAGYDVFLVLEATIGFNKRDDQDHGEASEEETGAPRTFEATGKIKLTTQDHKFLRALKIAVDEEAR